MKTLITDDGYELTLLHFVPGFNEDFLVASEHAIATGDTQYVMYTLEKRFRCIEDITDVEQLMDSAECSVSCFDMDDAMNEAKKELARDILASGSEA